jgi:2-isopropylmalate synthase
MNTSNQVIIFDTTLRDGEQSPGCSMNLDEKVRMVKQLERLRVDVVEAGFPIASQGDFEAVRALSDIVEHAQVAALCRSVPGDIQRAWEAIEHARKPRIHTFIATSDIHLKYKLKKTREQVIRDAVEAVTFAKSLCGNVEFSCEDASRSDPEYLCEIVAAAIEAGATVINLPDTVGYAIPEEYGAMFAMIRERVPASGNVVLSAHCHNDLGLAVANSLAALKNGARQVECTINGIGERAGNAALEEIVMAIATRNEKLQLSTGIVTEEIYKTSRLLSSVTGMLVQRNKAIVGSNAFAHEAGIHQDGVLKSALTYEIMSPQLVGVPRSTLVLGKHSGRHALRKRYEELGYFLSKGELDDIYRKFCDLADIKKEIFDEDLLAILEKNEAENGNRIYRLENLQVSSGTAVRPTATVELAFEERILIDSATGDGPVDAAFKAIERLTGLVGDLTEYSIKSVSSGRDALAEVFVRIAFDNISYNGRGVSPDVIAGSVHAYVMALNRYLIAKSKQEQSGAETMKKEAAAV